jgi:hypothetical protein
MSATVRVDDVAVGDRILYPHQRRNGAPVDQPVTVCLVVEYPANRVLYFAEGGYGIADRTVELALAPRPLQEVLDEHCAQVRAARQETGR